MNHDQVLEAPIAVEYSSCPDLSPEQGWVELNPTEEEIENYRSFRPPLYGYERVPPSLVEYGPENLVGRTITSIESGLGTDGMGGMGWQGLQFSGEPSMCLVYCLWNSGDWVHFEPNIFRKNARMQWTVQSVHLEERSLLIQCQDRAGLAITIRATEQPVAPRPDWVCYAREGHKNDARIRHMGELWRVCRANPDLWEV